MADRSLAGERHVLTQEDEMYPEALREIPRPPKTLYGIGNPQAMQPGLAIVGARRATPYGIGAAKRFGGIAAERGIVIISGGARGCDSAAHEAALSRKTPTVVFLGGGCDKVYPAQNFKLFQRVIDGGGFVVSENPFGFPPQPYTFRERNRLIAGLARATLIVEAGLPSGTFSTADEALQANREVLVVPGSITSKSSMGANRLIYQGAIPIIDDETFSDQLFSIFGEMKQENMRAASEEREGEDKDRLAILEAIRAAPMSLEQLQSVACGMKLKKDPLTWLMIALIDLERRRLITRYPDGKYGPVIKEERPTP